MEFKTAYPLLVTGTGGNFSAFLVVAGVLLMLLAGDRDGACRTVLTLAVSCLKSVLVSVAFRLRSTRSRRRR
jgi:hypothetical protein